MERANDANHFQRMSSTSSVASSGKIQTSSLFNVPIMKILNTGANILLIYFLMILVPRKNATIFQFWSRCTLFQQVAMISFIVTTFVIWIILLSVVSSNRTKLSEILG